jgi:hypothetical protein
MQITDDFLRKNKIKSVKVISSLALDPEFCIIHFDNTEYHYKLDECEKDDNNFFTDNVIYNHIKKVIHKNRKEKLERLKYEI